VLVVTVSNRTLIRELWGAVLEHDVAGLGAQLAYRFALAMLWLLIVFAALGGLVAEAFGGGNPTQRLMESAFSAAPADVRPVLEAQLQQLVDAHSPGLLFSAALGALWTGTAGFNAVMKALNQIHGARETRPYLRRVLLGATLTLSVGSLLLALLVTLLVRQVAGVQIANEIEIPAGVGRAFDWLAVPMSIPLLIGATAVLYRVTPDREVTMRWVSVGTLLFVGAWLGATFLFGIYLANFPSYANAYGAVATLLVLFTWFSITSFMLLLGAEVDVLVDRRRATGQLGSPSLVTGARESARARRAE
jgi:membrane protein